MEDDESGFYLNEVDGLSNDHPALPGYDDENKNDELNPDDTFDDLPTSLIVTNIHSSVFVSDYLKSELEDLFRQFSDDVTFQWLKSFRRLRVNYNDAVSAGECRTFSISRSYYGSLTKDMSILQQQRTLEFNFINTTSTTR